MDYSKSLKLSLLFYEAQRMGKLPPNFIIPWRGDSCLTDGKSIGKDLSGGFGDAGDNLCFTFAMASSFSLIGWSLLKFGDGYKKSGEYEHCLELFKWATDYLIKCHISKYEFVAQIGDGQLDHAYWGSVEVMNMARPIFILTKEKPGSDLCFEVSVCLTIAAMLYQDKDTTYSNLCMQHANELYEFGSLYQGKYSDSIPEVKEFYNSWSGYADENAWVELWRLKAAIVLLNRDKIVGVPNFYDCYNNIEIKHKKTLLSAELKWTQNWDDKTYGALVLAAELFIDTESGALYADQVEKYLYNWMNIMPKTASGISWLDQWGSLRYVANTCFMALIYYSNSTKPEAEKKKYREFAEQQMGCILGNNKQNFSYQIGYGAKYPLNPHHRNAHASWNGDIKTPAQNRHILWGALVGGPNKNDEYKDDRSDYISNEVALDYNAGFTGALAAICQLSGVENKVPLNVSFKSVGADSNEFDMFASIQYSNANSIVDIRIVFYNKTMYPPRKCINPQFVYYADLANFKSAKINYSNCGATLGKDATGYPLIKTSVEIYPGSEETCKKEIQFRIESADFKKDWSFQELLGLPKELIRVNKIAAFENGKLIWGTAPTPNITPTPLPAPVQPAPLPTPAPTPAPPNPAEPKFTEVFKTMYSKIHKNYFSAEKSPYHALEKYLVEAPDWGHETTSEGYSFWIMLEAYNALLTNSTDGLTLAWQKIEEHTIPTDAMQPTNSFYQANKPATFAGEFETPGQYPAPLEPSTPVGQDPLSVELYNAYKSNKVYGMHWLFDVDNVFKYGNIGDGVSKPSYINTFQRGENESVWETIPHPSWEAFKWGSSSAGFLPLFVKDQSYAKQWRYTNAPDADARVIQNMFKVLKFAPQLQVPELYKKSAKMADYLRYCLFDKYFKPIGCQDKLKTSTNVMDSCHDLISWYYSWGGSVDTQNGWAWKIGCSHVHSGYQNLVAAYAASAIPQLKPLSVSGATQWGKSMVRQIEFYKWLQSADGAIAGGATNSFNGRYEKYPDGTPTFYGMAYQAHPVFQDPPSNHWIGWQVWSMQRVSEYYYYTKDASVKGLIMKWVKWMVDNTIISDTEFSYPNDIDWVGVPYTYDPANPDRVNDKFRTTIRAVGHDIGLTGCYVKTLLMYSSAFGDVEIQNLCKRILLFMYNNHQDEFGFSIETIQDFTRKNDYLAIPKTFTGTMATGAPINSQSTFLSIRPFYNDLEGTSLKVRYHRFWEQVELATAFLEYDLLFGAKIPAPIPAPIPVPAPVIPTLPIAPAPSAPRYKINGAGVIIQLYPKYGNLRVFLEAGSLYLEYIPINSTNLTADTFKYLDQGQLITINIAAVVIPTPTPPPTPAPAPVQPSSNLVIERDIIDNVWPTGFVCSLKITNKSNTEISSWSFKVVVPADIKITGSWNMKEISNDSTGIKYGNLEYNGKLSPGQSTTFGFQGTLTKEDSVKQIKFIS